MPGWGDRGRALTRALVLLLFFLSGATGLVYEVVYARELLLVFGSTTYATAAVLSGFLAGLGLGAWALGAFADRIQRPLRMYALLEGGVALFALAFPLSLRLVEPLYAALYRGLEESFLVLSLVRFVAAFVMLLPATALMGATLPVLARALARAGALPRDLGVLYAINTVGGAAGTLAAAFLLIRALGLLGTIRAAALVNIALALAALALDRIATPARLGGEATGPAPATIALGRGARAVLLALFAVSGFAALALEVAWTRALVFVVGTSTYSFSLMLAVFLLSIVAGSALWSRLAPRFAEPLLVLGLAELLVAATALVSLPLLPRIAEAAGLSRFPAIAGPADGLVWLGKAAAVAFVVMGPPTLLLGAIFPLVLALLAGSGRGVAGDVGRGYAANTLGAILGSFVAGFALVPALGLRGTIAVASALAAAAGLTALALSPAARGRRLAAGAAGLALVAATLPLLRTDPFLEQVVKRRPGRLLYFQDGRDGSVAVFEERPAVFDRQMLVNGTPYAGTMPFARRYMKLLGHLPMLLAGRPEQVLVICFGTGTTLGAVLRHPELKAADLVDLNDAVLGAAGLFRDVNHGADRDPRARIVIGDGRNHVRLTERRYDVITFEPPPPAEAGAVNLYSADFYRQCLERLEPGGVVAQWLPLDDQSEADSRALIASFLAVFPDATLWQPVEEEAILIGTREPQRYVTARLAERMAAPGVAESLADIGIDTPAKLLRTWLMGRGELERYVGGIAPVTDDRPSAEFWSFFEPNVAVPTARRLLEQAGDPSARVDSPPPELHAELAGHRLFLGGALELKRDRQAAVPWFLRSLETAPDEYVLMAIGKSGREMARRIAILEGLRRERPDDPAVHAALGEELLFSKRLPEAEASYREALRLEPGNATARGGLEILSGSR